MADLIEPKEVKVKTQAGIEKTFFLSKIPAIPAREIVTQWPLTAMPKLGDYKSNEAIMQKMMAYVEALAPDGSTRIRLTTPDLINNHVPDWETLGRLEAGMMEYNVSFFGQGKSSLSLEAIIQKARPLILKILTASSVPSSPKEEQPLKN